MLSMEIQAINMYSHCPVVAIIIENTIIIIRKNGPSQRKTLCEKKQKLNELNLNRR